MQMTRSNFMNLALAGLVCACSTSPAGTTATMGGETARAAQNQAVFKRIVDEGLNQGKTEVLDELFASNLVDHDLPPGTPAGPEGSKGKIAYFLSAFPDLHFTFDDATIDGDKIAGRGYFTGTHKGEFQGIPPTGKQVKVKFMDLWRFENGKVAEYWGQPDVMGLMQQLGAIPTATPSIPVAGHNETGKAFMDAFRANDVEAIAALYAEDAIYYPTDTMAVAGAKNIRASFAGFLGAFTVEEASTSEVMHMTRGDVSLSWGKWGGTLVPKAGGKRIAFEGRFSDISKLIDGRWTYIFDHASFPTGAGNP